MERVVPSLLCSGGHGEGGPLSAVLRWSPFCCAQVAMERVVPSLLCSGGHGEGGPLSAVLRWPWRGWSPLCCAQVAMERVVPSLLCSGGHGEGGSLSAVLRWPWRGWSIWKGEGPKGGNWEWEGGGSYSLYFIEGFITQYSSAVEDNSEDHMTRSVTQMSNVTFEGSSVGSVENELDTLSKALNSFPDNTTTETMDEAAEG